MMFMQRSRCWLLVVAFTALWLGRESVPLRKDAEEVSKETMALVQQIQKARDTERLNEQLPAYDGSSSQTTEDDITGTELGNGVTQEEQSLGGGNEDDYFDYVADGEDGNQINKSGEDNVKDVGNGDRFVDELMSESDSANHVGSDMDLGKSDTGIDANSVDKVTKTPAIQDKPYADKEKEANGDQVARFKEIENDDKRHIVDGILSDIDDLIMQLHAYENISRTEQEHATKFASERGADDGEPRGERSNSNVALANVRRALNVVRKSTDGHHSGTDKERDHCEAVLGVTVTPTKSCIRHERLRDDRTAALEESLHVKLVDNDVYHFEHIEPDIKVTFRGNILTRPMGIDEQTSNTTYVVENDEQFQDDIVLTPEYALEIWDETLVSMRSGDLRRSYLESNKMEKTLLKTTMVRAGANDVNKRDNKDEVLELLSQLRRLLEARQRHKRAADSRGTNTPMAEVLRCLLQILNRHEQCPDAEEAAITKRNMQAEDLWELPIRYEMSENISKFYKQLTCGSSLVGKQPRGNIINIAPECFDRRTIVHEVGHSLGLWHEHSRPDRDDHVTVMWDNIPDVNKADFLKKSWQNTVVHGLPYDLDSVMHYPSWAMASYSKPSLVPFDTAMLSVMGRGNKLSFGDAALVNFHYCSSACNKRDLRWRQCQHGGYRDPLDCQRCRCVDGWAGDDRCSTVDTNMTGEWTSPVGTTIQVRFVDVFAMRCSLGCDDDWVEVRLKSVDRPGPRFCCIRPYVSLISAGNQVMILFRSHVENYIESQGFKLEYSISVPACGVCDNGATPAPACSREISHRCK
ncbi:hypothetical protein NP493_1099g00004 [Ridgeia piscesae]|uniref:Metalloendopeptidase n=1 Tax=Ridgeia piscesae TaxID=27915 RepID=A0AAD9KI02_RIDPI|nr:hypothetical protein NP493_1099g00004 [Ridgeia piscesae]